MIHCLIFTIKREMKNTGWKDQLSNHGPCISCAENFTLRGHVEFRLCLCPHVEAYQKMSEITRWFVRCGV